MSRGSLYPSRSVIVIIITISCTFSYAKTSNKKMCIEKESKALLKFKRGLIDEFGVLASWDSQKDCCSWRGIQCHSRTGHVIELGLSGYISDDLAPKRSLSGEIDPSLLELQYLNHLDLSFNAFDGLEIPDFFGSFAELKYLNLSGAGFSKEIPNRLGNLSNLQTLDLSRNSDLIVKNLDWLSGISSSLKSLYLSELDLSQVFTWQEMIDKLPSLVELQLSSCDLPNINQSSLPPPKAHDSLQILELSGNRLSPSVLFRVSKISRKLVRIGLSGCQMKGRIPDVFANMKSLVSLDLSYNQLEGGFPRSFRNLCSLESLNVLENKISDRLFDSMKSLSCSEGTMKHLSLSGNPFSGPFPDLSNFSSLIELFLDVTNITGPLPRNFTQFSKLVSLSLGSNKLTGPLPDFTGLLSLTQLFFSRNRLNGSVPESLGKLSSLEYLDISSNSLEGVLTETHFSNLSRLRYLTISENRLSLNLSSGYVPHFQLSSLSISSCKVGPGFPTWLRSQSNLSSLYASESGIADTIPEWFWGLPSLSIFNLSSNQIHGKFPDLSLKNYTFFSIDLSSNNLNGPIPPLPISRDIYLSKNKLSGPLTTFCDSQSLPLSHLDLSENQLSGKLPNCWSRFPSLLTLNLAKNNFTGKIPISLSSLQSIMLLRLHENRFIGEIPSLENCTELRVVDLGKNKFSGGVLALSGQNLPKLLVLSLRHNEIAGEFPSSLCRFPYLRVLDFSENRISGQLPECLDNMTAFSQDVDDNRILGFVDVMWKGIEREFGDNLRHLRSIDVSSNSLTGDIPQSITRLSKLVSLNLSRNNLDGTIPRGFEMLRSLESLDLSRNRISGRIPTEFAGMNFLSYLDLSYNKMRGRIPMSTQLQSFGASSYAGNIELCGAPITKRCPGDESETDRNPNASEMSEDDDDEIITPGFYVSIGIGFFVGFWGIFGSFLLKRSYSPLK